eukprot:5240956-Amphidinium_carterae.1
MKSKEFQCQSSPARHSLSNLPTVPYRATRHSIVQKMLGIPLHPRACEELAPLHTHPQDKLQHIEGEEKPRESNLVHMTRAKHNV